MTPSFFDLAGRVFFGAASTAEIDQWFRQVEATLATSGVPAVIDVEALVRVSRRRCRERPACDCEPVVQRGRRLLAAVGDHETML